MTSLTEHIGRSRNIHGIPNVNDLYNNYDLIHRWQSNAGATTSALIGFPAALTARGTPVNADDAFGQFIGYPTTTTNNNVAGLNTPATYYRATWIPNIGVVAKLGPNVISQRIWIGLFSADPSASANPAAHLAGFRFDTGAGDTTFKACTKDGTTLNALETGALPAIDGRMSFGIEAEGAVGAQPFRWHFFINRARVATSLTGLPVSATTNLGFYASITNLQAGTARTLRLGRISVMTQG